MGTVYRVADEQLDEVVALKIIGLTQVRSEDLTRFKREVKLARRITHPNVARTFDIGEHEGTPFLTMEFIDGHSVDALIDEPMEPAQAVAIALAVTRGLEAAHSAGVVHRDLKPANVLVDGGGRVVLTDFGVARSVLDESRATGIIGTPAYMSPEQVLGESLDHRSDIYSFGILLYEMLTATLPFAGEAMAAVLARCREAPTDPREHAPVPDDLAALTLACLARDREARPASAAEVARRLESWLGGSATEHSGSPLFAPLHAAPLFPKPRARSVRTLAVLPFKVQGSEEYLGDSLAQELIDVLARSRGMRVLAFGTGSKYRDIGDPRRVGDELGVDAIVEGSVQSRGDRIRVAVRMHEVETGLQLWSERFDARLADVFDIETIMSQRIANALRVELQVVESRGTVSGQSLSFYLQGRRELGSTNYARGEAAVELFERCLEASPGFRPALAAHAMAAVRAWWSESLVPSGRNWSEIAANSVERARQGAPELAETHLACAMHALAIGDVGKTVSDLCVALEIAPALAEAQRYLGELLVEVGRLEEGKARLRLALELDATRLVPHIAMARVSALHGDYEACEHELATLERTAGEDSVPSWILRARVAAWRRDVPVLRELSERAKTGEGPALMFLAAILGFILGEGGGADIAAAIKDWSDKLGNLRMSALVSQMMVESHCFQGDHEQGMRWLLGLCDAGAFIDVVWLEKCPLLEPLRGMPEYAVAAAKVARRAATIRWLDIPRL
jgi:serine/threonine-protein kinase